MSESKSTDVSKLPEPTEELGWEHIGHQRVAAVLHRAIAAELRLVIMAHGFKGSKIGPSRYFVTLGRHLAGRGVSVFRFDQPGSGDSAGTFEESSFIEWIGTIEHFARRFHEDGYKIALLGQSMGGTATLAAADWLGSGIIRGIALWSSSPEEGRDASTPDDGYVEEDGQRVRRRFWHEAAEVDFLGLYQRLSVPAFMVFGTADHLIPLARIRAVESACKASDRVLVLDGLPHSAWPLEARERILSETADFLVGVLTESETRA